MNSWDRAKIELKRSLISVSSYQAAVDKHLLCDNNLIAVLTLNHFWQPCSDLRFRSLLAKFPDSCRGFLPRNLSEQSTAHYLSALALWPLKNFKNCEVYVRGITPFSKQIRRNDTRPPRGMNLSIKAWEFKIGFSSFGYVPLRRCGRFARHEHLLRWRFVRRWLGSPYMLFAHRYVFCCHQCPCFCRRFQ